MSNIFLLLTLIGLCGISKTNAMLKITFNKEFAPQKSLIKKVEKPYRDENYFIFIWNGLLKNTNSYDRTSFLMLWHSLNIKQNN
jgi:hypothetical protein